MQTMNKTNIKQVVIGKLCQRAWDGLLPAIFFELGEKLTEKKGEISLCFDTCPWQLFKNGIEIANSKDSREVILSAITKIENTKVSNFEVSDDEKTINVTFGQFTISAFLNAETDTFYIVGSNNDEIVYGADVS